MYKHEIARDINNRIKYFKRHGVSNAHSNLYKQISKYLRDAMTINIPNAPDLYQHMEGDKDTEIEIKDILNFNNKRMINIKHPKRTILYTFLIDDTSKIAVFFDPKDDIGKMYELCVISKLGKSWEIHPTLHIVLLQGATHYIKFLRNIADMCNIPISEAKDTHLFNMELISPRPSDKHAVDMLRDLNMYALAVVNYTMLIVSDDRFTLERKNEFIKMKKNRKKKNIESKIYYEYQIKDDTGEYVSALNNLHLLNIGEFNDIKIPQSIK